MLNDRYLIENDGRGEYRSTVKFKALDGYLETVKKAAALEGVNTSEFIRRAIAVRIEQVEGAKPAGGDRD